MAAAVPAEGKRRHGAGEAEFMKPSHRQIRSERGVILILFVIGIIAVFLISGLVVDLGVAFVTTSKLSRATDAGALAGARHTSAGTTGIKAMAQKVAEANFSSTAVASTTGSNYTVTVDSPATDTIRVTVNGAARANTYFSRLIGKTHVDVSTVAEATRFPLDMSLVLDLSYSLQRNNAFDDMQAAATHFLDYFDDNIDQFGLVTYSTWAEEKMSLRKNFKATGKSIIAVFLISGLVVDLGVAFVTTSKLSR
ncbi:MAG: TadE/TadG family protein, partial [Deltaproteobacteria bacterium]